MSLPVERIEIASRIEADLLTQAELASELASLWDQINTNNPEVLARMAAATDRLAQIAGDLAGRVAELLSLDLSVDDEEYDPYPYPELRQLRTIVEAGLAVMLQGLDSQKLASMGVNYNRAQVTQ